MLVLTRKSGQAIVLETENGPVIIEVNSIRGNQFKFAIEAPQSVRIKRMEAKEGEAR